MTARGTDHLHEEIHRLIRRHIKEYRMTFAEVIGVLELCKAQGIRDFFGDDDDDGDDDNPAESPDAPPETSAPVPAP